MDMRHLKITIAGSTGAGKTTVAHMLAYLFKQAGNNVELHFTDDSTVNWTEERLQQCIESLLKDGNLKVEIETVRLNRIGSCGV